MGFLFPPAVDTIDLQDPVAPSAQDHSRGRLATSNTTGSNSLAPHQAETIREVSSDAADEQSRSPRISWEGDGKGVGDIHQFAEDLTVGPNRSALEDDSDDDQDPNMSQEDALAIAQNGGISSSDEGDLDGDADDLDDDMMDKISSSPSIEDGGCCPVITPVAWPRRVSSLPPALRDAPQHLRGSSLPRPSSPYPELLKHMPSHSTHPKLPRAIPMVPKRRLLGEYDECHATESDPDPEYETEPRDRFDDEHDRHKGWGVADAGRTYEEEG